MRLLPLFIIGLLSLTGCSTWNISALEPEQVTQLAATPYPESAPLGDDLDILVVTHGRSLQLVNRTPRSYNNIQLWLNQQFVGNVETIAIGTDNSVNLLHFINRYHETYPAGSFLHPDRAFPVVKAEIYDPAAKVRHRLIARQAGL